MDELAQLKATLRQTWATGDYPSIAQWIRSAGIDIVERVKPRPGERVLDVACGVTVQGLGC
jgi:hypothetical protein